MEEQLSKKQQKRQERMGKREEQRSRDVGARQTKSAITWLVTIVIIVGIVWSLVALVRNSSGGGHLGATSEAITESDWTIGDPSAAIHLIEYSDLQCPACAAYEPLLDQLLEEYEGDIYFAYRHFPLRSIHPHAQLAAQATEAAGLQGKFWEMHNLIFENQTSWSVRPRIKDILIEFAADIEIDVDKFEEDLESSAVKSAVDADSASASVLGLRSTPSFILNGERIPNPSHLSQARAMFDAILDEGSPAGHSME